MTNQEHIVAVVEPTASGEAPLDVARETVHRGGRATVVILLNRRTDEDIRNFAAAEDLTFPDAREIFLERLTDTYSALLGGESRVVATGEFSARSIMEGAARISATSIAMPQTTARRYGWRGAIKRSHVPVVISPRRAA